MAYYSVTGNPVQDTRGTSPSIRAEFALIAAGFAALPVQAAIWGASANYGVDTGSADAYVVSIAATYITGYTDGLTIKVKAINANTGAATVNLNALGIKSIVRPDGSVLSAGDIPAGAIVTLSYNTTTGKFQLAISGVASATSAAASAAAAAASASAAAASASAASTSATNAANSATAAAASAASINPADLMHLSGTETATGAKTFSGAVVINGALSGAGVTKAAVGLGNVDNTPDASKPVSTAQQQALQSQLYTAFTAGGTSTAFTLTPSPALAAYAAGQSFWMTTTVAAGASPTLNISGLGATVNLVYKLPSGSLANINGNMPAGSYRVTLLNTTQALVDGLPPVLGVDAVRGLVGAVNATTPLTKYDLQAAAVTLRNSANAAVVQFNTATITCDLGLAGPAANGRDQSGAFAINTWVYLYFIWNPVTATLAALASTTAPASFTGSTLPTGYTHWAFATALRWNASSNIIPAFTQGASVFYDLADGGANRVVSGGVAAVMTAVSCSGLIPPVAVIGKFNFALVCTDAAAKTFNLFVRKTGSSITGIIVVRAAQAAGLPGNSANAADFPVNASGQFDYKLDTAPSVGGGVFIDVLGYVLPNGDA